MTESEFLHMFGWMNRSTSWQREYEAIEELKAERDALRKLLLDVLDYMDDDESYKATLLRRNIDAAIDAARKQT